MQKEEDCLINNLITTNYKLDKILTALEALDLKLSNLGHILEHVTESQPNLMKKRICQWLESTKIES